MSYTETPVALVGAQFDVNTAADKVIFTVPFDCRVRNLSLTIEGTDAGGATVKFDKRPTAGSDTGRGDGDVGTITIPASDQEGKVLEEVPTSNIKLKRGEQVVVEVTAESVTALNCVPTLELEYIPEISANQTNVVAA